MNYEISTSRRINGESLVAVADDSLNQATVTVRSSIKQALNLTKNSDNLSVYPCPDVKLCPVKRLYQRHHQLKGSTYFKFREIS